MNCRDVFIGAMVAFAISGAHADVFRCTGSDGKTVYQETPCATGVQRQVDVQDLQGGGRVNSAPATQGTGLDRGGRASRASVSDWFEKGSFWQVGEKERCNKLMVMGGDSPERLFCYDKVACAGHFFIHDATKGKPSDSQMTACVNERVKERVDPVPKTCCIHTAK